MMTVKSILESLVVRFNEKARRDEVLQKELEGVRKRVHIDLGQEQYSFVLEDKEIRSFCESSIENPDITVCSDPQTIEALVSGTMKPMKALALKKMRVRGSLEDILRLRRFF